MTHAGEDRTPIVIDPPNFDLDAAWRDCEDWVERHGGLSAGNPSQMAAAMGADPGIVSCPVCGRATWRFGLRQQCRDCAFEYPTDWWPMYAAGCQLGRARQIGRHQTPSDRERAHPYFLWGAAHPVDRPYEERHRIPWRDVLADWVVFVEEENTAHDRAD